MEAPLASYAHIKEKKNENETSPLYNINLKILASLEKLNYSACHIFTARASYKI